LVGLPLGIVASDTWWKRSSFAASRITPAARALQVGVRLWIALMRSVHELIWAVVLLAAMGLNTFGAVLAIAIPYAGTLAKVFSASLFVTLFLGASGIPFVHGSDLIAAIAPLVGSTLPALLVVVLGIGVFFAKLVIVLLLGEIISRRVAALRSDQRTRLVAYRLLPLAWANLLLVSAMTLLAQPFVGEG